MAKVLVSLTEMKTGEEGTIVSMGGKGPFPRRLWVLGLFPGRKIKKVSSSPGGGPIVLLCGTQELALGRGLATRIMVEVER